MKNILNYSVLITGSLLSNIDKVLKRLMQNFLRHFWK